MTTVSLELPNSLHEKIRQLAKEEGISINQFIVSAAAEKMASLLTEEYLQERARRGDVDQFQSVLDKVPDVEPEEYDRIDP
ncbi:MAG: toxin-antitoxin system HicB family antitoxin [Desulfococcaceae bacterium]